jgi:Protein of unknown function (DUF3309)
MPPNDLRGTRDATLKIQTTSRNLFSGRFGGYGYGHGGVGVLGIILLIVVVLLLTGRL